MTATREVNFDLNSVKATRSVQRNNAWLPTHHSFAGKVFIGVASVVMVGGFFAAVIVPIGIATSKAASENAETTTTLITTTVTTTTATTATTSTTTSATTTTSVTTTTTSTTTTSTTATTTTTSTTTTTTTTSTTATTSTTKTTTTTSQTTSTTTSTTTTQNPYACGNMTILYGYDLGGSDITSATRGNYSLCCSWCQSYSGCVAFTWGLSTAGSNVNVCFLKNAVPASSANAVLSSAHY